MVRHHSAFPRAHNLSTHVREVSDISGCESCAAGQHDSCDLRITHVYRLSSSLSFCRQERSLLGRRAVENPIPVHLNLQRETPETTSLVPAYVDPRAAMLFPSAPRKA